MENEALTLPCIVVIDDDRDQLFLTCNVLERSGIRHRRVEMHGGREAIEYLGRCCRDGGEPAAALPALVFLDLKMPNVDGFAVLDWIRGQASLRDLKVIVLTSSDNLEEVERCRSLGAQGFLIKHPSPVLVGCVVRQALSLCATDDLVEAPKRSDR